MVVDGDSVVAVVELSLQQPLLLIVVYHIEIYNNGIEHKRMDGNTSLNKA